MTVAHVRAWANCARVDIDELRNRTWIFGVTVTSVGARTSQAVVILKVSCESAFEFLLAVTSVTARTILALVVFDVLCWRACLPLTERRSAEWRHSHHNGRAAVALT